MGFEIIQPILSYLTLTSDIFIAILLILYIVYLATRSSFIKERIFLHISENFILLSFLVSLVATLGSLSFSYLLGYAPCELCWFQRVLMYPQAMIFAIALIRKDKVISIYSLVLSLIGLPIALFQYIAQVSSVQILSCPTVGYSASCASNFFTTLGYITIPMMSLSAFALLIIFQAANLCSDRKKTDKK